MQRLRVRRRAPRARALLPERPRRRGAGRGGSRARAQEGLGAPDGREAAPLRGAEHGALRGRGAGDGARRERSPSSPLHLVFVSTGDGAPRASFPRVRIRAGAGSRALVIQDHVSLGRGARLSDRGHRGGGRRERAPSSSCCCSARATRPSISANLQARLARDARFASRTLTFGGALVRNDLGALLAAPGAECQLDGLFLGSGERLVDNHTLVDHAEPRCTSRELYKGILADRSRGVFRGRIVVRPDAQQTDAQQSNANLLLGAGAEIDTKPQLEIWADDVRCSHGASIGRLDEDALFYLRSRGIGEDAARDLLDPGLRLGGIAPDRQRAAGRGARRRAAGAPARGRLMLDLERIRKDFPILQRTLRGKPLVYLDSAASAQKPRAVIEAIRSFYETSYANIHRGVYELSETATRLHDEARVQVQRLLGAGDPREVDLRTEHHRGDQPRRGELRPEPRARRRRGADHHPRAPFEHRALAAALRGAGRPARGGADRRPRRAADPDAFEALLSERTRLVAIAHVSNALGTLLPVAELTRLAQRAGAVVLVDGAQAVPRMPVDVRALGCDFYAFSGHKLYGPTGIGVPLGPPRAARGDAALAERRRHDLRGALREDQLRRAAPEVRGRHPRHRRRDRPRRGDRLPAGPRHGARRTPRARAARLRHRAPRRDPRAAPRRHRPREDGRALLRPRRRAPPRRGHDPRPGGRRDPRRPPLRAAADGAPRAAGHRARVARHLQRRGRHRPRWWRRFAR